MEEGSPNSGDKTLTDDPTEMPESALARRDVKPKHIIEREANQKAKSYPKTETYPYYIAI